MDELTRFAARLGEREEPVLVFFRDDDAGWASDRLRALTRIFGEYDVPLDLAAIPGAIDRTTTTVLFDLLHQGHGRVRLHQHGYTHTNHELTGRKSEFGASRSAEAQRDDIATGRKRLQDVFDEFVDPVFTPPWNRCTNVTCEVLAEIGFGSISRIAGSKEIDHHGLCDLSTHVDWQKSRDGQRLSRIDLLGYAANRIENNDVVGIMLHHEKMDNEELDFFSAFLGALCKSSQVRFQSMSKLTENRKRTTGDQPVLA